jgi:hypothetical protein
VTLDHVNALSGDKKILSKKSNEPGSLKHADIFAITPRFVLT